LALACCALLAGTIGVTAQAGPAGAAVPAAKATTANPFSKASTLPFETPAFEEGMKLQRAEVEKIANDPAIPTFENTIVAMEKTGAMLNRVMAVFELLAGADTNPTLQKVQEVEAPKLAAHQDAIFLNPKLFARIQKLYDQRATLKLDPESARLLEYDYQQFVHNGAKLSSADKAKLKHYNEQISTLSAQFQNKLLAADKAGALVVNSAAELKGLSPGEIDAAAQDAKARGLKGKWVIPLQNTTQQPALGSLDDRDVRHELFEHSWTRAEKGDANDTRATIEEMAYLRAQKAKLLGFDTYAAWKLENQMAKTSSAVMNFLDQLAPPAVARAEAEGKDRQNMIDKNQKKAGKPDFKLAAWDWDYYGEQVRKAKYDFDESQVEPYFELNNVLENGVFYAANQLYGLTFKERKDLPVWEPTVRVFEVSDANGKPLALFYCDYFKRDNKGGGAWMSNLVTQSKLLNEKPVIYNVANFTKPAPGQPALLSFDDVITMFHEFGHALNGMFADQEYPSLSGTVPQRDFVEFPSQFNEHWALYPTVFAHYAKHYKTGEPMPKALVDKLKNSQLFNKGYDMTELISAALLDMSWHTISPSAPKVSNVDAFEARALKDNHVDLSYVPPRYRSSYF